MDVPEQPDESQGVASERNRLPWWGTTTFWVVVLAGVAGVAALVLAGPAASAAGGCGGG